LDPEWGADEELLFIDGLAACGMGNWAGVAEHVGTKTKEECEAHYLKVYVNSSQWPKPVSKYIHRYLFILMFCKKGAFTRSRKCDRYITFT
jgi:hypothetical protein